MGLRQDRTVHARYPGMEIVRYDRSGKWYLEPTVTGARRQAVSITDAANQAIWGSQNGGTIFTGRSGGGMFDRKVRGEA